MQTSFEFPRFALEMRAQGREIHFLVFVTQLFRRATYSRDGKHGCRLSGPVCECAAHIEHMLLRTTMQCLIEFDVLRQRSVFPSIEPVILWRRPRLRRGFGGQAIPKYTP